MNEPKPTHETPPTVWLGSSDLFGPRPLRPTAACNVGGVRDCTARQFANAIWNKLNIALACIGTAANQQGIDNITEARELADILVAHPDSGSWPNVEMADANRTEEKDMSKLSNDQMREMLANFRPLQVPSMSSAEAPSKPAGPVGSLVLTTCSLPVVEAEALLRIWDNRRLKAIQRFRREGMWVADRVEAETLEQCVDDLRNLMGLPGSRQPRENDNGEPRSLKTSTHGADK